MAFTDNIKQIAPSLVQLKNNTPVLIVDNKVLVNGIGGNFIPAGQGAEGGGGGVDIYSKAVFVLDFEDSIPTYTNTGNAITSINYPSGAPSVGIVDGINCIHCNGNGLRIKFENFASLYNRMDLAVSFWAKSEAGTPLGRDCIVFLSDANYANAKNLAIGSDVRQADGFLAQYELEDDHWHHYLFNCQNGSGSFYVDGEIIDSFAVATPAMTGNTVMAVGGILSGWLNNGGEMVEYKDVRIAAIKVFYTAIPEDKITALASEFTPTNS